MPCFKLWPFMSCSVNPLDNCSMYWDTALHARKPKALSEILLEYILYIESWAFFFNLNWC